MAVLVFIPWLSSPFVQLTLAQTDADLFESKIRPIFVEKCQKCHGPDKQKAGLRLDHKAGWQNPGDRGAIIVPGKPDESLLLKVISYNDPLLKMPPDKKLSDQEINAIRLWVNQGAVDPRVLNDKKVGSISLDQAKAHWSFKPVQNNFDLKGLNSKPIDFFISQKLKEINLPLSPKADKRTLIRRLYYDITGLPPSYSQVINFLNDNSPNATEKVIDQLFSSSNFGENAGRRWLDLVRFADTAGENSDHPLPYAYKYRDYVIKSFNNNKPYDQFVQEQIAGDIYAAKNPTPSNSDQIIATGFLAIARRFGHEIEKEMHLTHEDAIDTLGKSLLGLTLGCARCHDHKYDPISAKDYYALYGILDSTRFPFPGCEPKQQPKDLVSIETSNLADPSIVALQKKIEKQKAELAKILVEEGVFIQSFLASIKTPVLLGKGVLKDGSEQDIATTAIEGNLPISVTNGQMIQLSLFPQKNHGMDSTKVEFVIQEVDGKRQLWNVKTDLIDVFLQSNPAKDSYGNLSVWAFFDCNNGLRLLPETLLDFQKNIGLNIWKNGDTPSVFVNASNNIINAWTKLPSRSFFMHPGQNGAVSLAWFSPIKGKISIQGNLKDVHPGGIDGVDWKLELFNANIQPSLNALTLLAEKKKSLNIELLKLQQSLPLPQLAYAVAEKPGKNIKLHLRGDPERLGEEVPRRWLEIFGSNDISNPSASGRKDLALWVTSPANPLTARVMVNRIWGHYFGKGIVKSSNDFGLRGEVPTHPELLDWLASEFIRSGWNIKHIHKLIVLSDAYQQSSTSSVIGLEKDTKNDFYWRMDKRRLKAEEIRDSLLFCAGDLDNTSGIKHPFPPEATWNFTQHNPFNANYDHNKRSVYLMVKRNSRHQFLGLFDGADPNTTTPLRQVTTVPTQALYFMNDPFFHLEAEKLATIAFAFREYEKIVNTLFQISLQRPPTESEKTIVLSLLNPKADKNLTVKDWASVARLLLASNEFVFLD